MKNSKAIQPFKQVSNRISSLRLRTKLVLLISLLITSISLFIFLYFPATQSKSEFDNQRKNALTIAHIAAHSLTSAIVFDDTIRINKEFDALAQNTDIVYIVIIDDSNKRVAAFELDKATKAEFFKPSYQNNLSQDESIYNTSISIEHNGASIGRLYLGVSMVGVYDKVNNYRINIALMSLAIFLVGIISVFSIGTMTTQHLGQIVNTVEKISKGDLSLRAPIISQDEIGDLSRSFNIMVDNVEVAYNKLSASEERYRTLFENNPHSMWVIGENTLSFLAVNDAAVKHYGYSREEFLRMTYNDIHPVGELPKILNFISNSEASINQTNPWKQKKKNGTLITVEIATHTIEYGGKAAHLVLATDITERKIAEEQQGLLLKKLEKTNRDLNEFAYIVSHDLKAPLRAMGSLTNWIANDYGGKFDTQGKEMLSLLIGRVRRMYDLIEGILLYSRVGRTQEQINEVSLQDEVSEIITSLAPPSHIEIKIETALPTIKVERTKIRQIFQNLISNAIQYMDKPKGLIRIGCEQENGRGKYYVSDNGPGIDKKHFEKIFQIFQTLAPRDKIESTGIGLAIVKKIIEINGGKIHVESTVGQGTTFIFTLPEKDYEINL